MKAKALTDTFSVVDEHGTHTWTIGKEYTITPHGTDIAIQSDIGVAKVMRSELWQDNIRNLFGVDIDVNGEPKEGHRDMDSLLASLKAEYDTHKKPIAVKKNDDIVRQTDLLKKEIEYLKEQLKAQKEATRLEPDTAIAEKIEEDKQAALRQMKAQYDAQKGK